VKEQAKKRNIDLQTEQRQLMELSKRLEMEAEKEFGAQINQANDRAMALEKEIKHIRNESLEIESKTRFDAV